eukprot:scaffold1395_cov152-Amphora_coffeaeformis.AAC.16
MGLLPTSWRGALSFDNAEDEAAGRSGDDKGENPSAACPLSKHNAIAVETVFLMAASSDRESK